MKTERLEIGGSLAFESVKYAVVEGYQTPPGDASFEFIERSPDAWFSDTETSVSIDESTARKLIDALSEHFGVVAQAAQPAQMPAPSHATPAMQLAGGLVKRDKCGEPIGWLDAARVWSVMYAEFLKPAAPDTSQKEPAK